MLQMAALAPIHEHGPLVIAEASGNTLRDIYGREFVDGINGLFNVNVGYGRVELADVASTTMRASRLRLELLRQDDRGST
jgi:adenosylmethionine-8-amino-7-oxononanoate aminotransferase